MVEQSKKNTFKVGIPHKKTLTGLLYASLVLRMIKNFICQDFGDCFLPGLRNTDRPVYKWSLCVLKCNGLFISNILFPIQFLNGKTSLDHFLSMKFFL